MKRYIHLSVMIAFVCLASPALAADPLKGDNPFQSPMVSQKGQAAKPVSRKPLATLEVTGKVSAITLADPTKGIRPEISVADEAGTIITLLVRPTTTIYDQEWKPITLDKLAVEQIVRVQYTKNKEGVLMAVSIKPVVNK